MSMDVDEGWRREVRNDVRKRRNDTHTHTKRERERKV